MQPAVRPAGRGPCGCTKYLTSSQTLTFNMLSEVAQLVRRWARLFGFMLGRDDLAWLESADFEFSGVDTPYWLGDRTLVDLLLRFRRTDGGLQVVAVETKLADRFSTRRTREMEAYAINGWLSAVQSGGISRKVLIAT